TVQVQDQPETKDVSLVEEENNTEENGMSDMEQKTLANNTINE
ncbi:MAG TPA: NADH:ubiquinone reductase (Na(+)-transporting) subunit E, partial [Xanthomarina gelatinilytica]|nr:NADH:ubiquinone reductase (Na(+)-transporting) subunit E [Xanthomarina gelatinilytica]